MRTIKTLVSLSPVFGIIGACHGVPRELDRPTAAAILARSSQVAALRLEIPLHQSGFMKGVALELWAGEGSPTAKGEKLFQKATTRYVRLRDSLSSLPIEITGITDAALGQGAKEVHFSWSYADLPSPTVRLAVSGGTGTAYFRKYDDGWRVEEASLSPSGEPAPLSKAEVRLESDELARIAEERKAYMAAMAERNRLSRTPTMVVLTDSSEFLWSGNDQTFGFVLLIMRAVVTDVDLQLTFRQSWVSGVPDHPPVDQTFSISFGDITAIVSYNTPVSWRLRPDQYNCGACGILISVPPNTRYTRGGQARLVFPHGGRDQFLSSLKQAYASWAKKFGVVGD